MLQLYALLAPMLYCDAITDAMTKGLGQQKACVQYNIITSIMDVAGLYILLPSYGMTGYYISFLISHLTNFLLSLGRLRKITGLSIPFHLPAMTLAATLLSVWGAGQFFSPILRAFAFSGLYFSLLTLFQILSMEDIRWIRGLLHKK